MKSVLSAKQPSRVRRAFVSALVLLICFAVVSAAASRPDGRPHAQQILRGVRLLFWLRRRADGTSGRSVPPERERLTDRALFPFHFYRGKEQRVILPCLPHPRF